MSNKLLYLLSTSLLIGGCGSSDPTTTTTASSDCSTTVTTGITTTLPAGMVMKPITGGSFTMGNNNLVGPSAGHATEHTVTVSAFEMSETEVTNGQYLEFLNLALADGLVEVGTVASGPFAGNKIIQGTSTSTHQGKFLYSLSGSRVLKDHGNEDGDGNSFTGVIEPENPLNIAYIGYNSTDNAFFIKDPKSATDFNWTNLTDYCDYHATTAQQFLTDAADCHNDFGNWTELNGWTVGDPSLGTKLPTKAEVTDWPVTFIGWWGANAFALYYGVTLPSEAQWEYAAKGGDNYLYSVHDGVDFADATWNQNSDTTPLGHAVTVKNGSSNPFGLYNLGGNVWEWMADNYVTYAADAVTDPLITDCSTLRSWRGGAWNYHKATLETSSRFSDDEAKGNDHFGFRVTK
ncbi:MAG: sulfatase modifying factor 1 [Polaribacter sp.]|jgi:sulfatase modifying factor 1